MPTKAFKATFKLGTKANSDEPDGTVEAIVSVFNNVDRAGEKVLPGYFAKSLAEKLPKGVWMHDWTRPIAVTDDAKELLPGDPLLPENLKQLGGLYVKGRLNLDVQDGRDALSHLKFGSVDEFSFGYSNTKTAYDENTGVRELIEGDIFEWSPVLVGCNPATALLSAKNGRLADPDDLLQQVDEIFRLLGGKTLDDGHRGRIAKLAPVLAQLGETPAKSASASDLGELNRRFLAVRESLLLPA